MKPYVHCFILAGLLTVGCQRSAGPTATETGSAERGGSASSGAVEIPAHTQFYVRFDKTVDSAKVKQGDLVTGTLDQAIVAGGGEVLPRGTKLGVRVTNAQLAQSAGSVGLLTLNIENVRHAGAEYQVKALPVTVETSPLTQAADPKAQIPHTPLTQKQGRANAVLQPDQALLFETTDPFSVKP
jgi:hypothetical protein